MPLLSPLLTLLSLRPHAVRCIKEEVPEELSLKLSVELEA
jgi:hypothetical protein